MKKSSSTTFLLCNALIGFGVVAGLVMGVRQHSFPDDTRPCSERYLLATSFPPLLADNSNQPANPHELNSVLGMKAWGIIQNAKVVRDPEMKDAPVLEVRLPKGGGTATKAAAGPAASAGASKLGIGFTWRHGLDAKVSAACLSYGVQLDKNFQFLRGGHLPGLFGGRVPAIGRDVDVEKGFAVKVFWRDNQLGEVVAFVPGHADGKVFGLDRGGWKFQPGQWARIEKEVVLNTPDKADGILRVWVDGHLKVEKTDMVYRTSGKRRVTGVAADITYTGQDEGVTPSADTSLRITPFELRWQ